MPAGKQQTIMVRIALGVILGIISLGMLLYLVPQGNPSGPGPETLAQVGDDTISVSEVAQQLQRFESRGQFPKTLEPLYAQQILNQLVFERELELEARRLGVHVSDEERTDRIRMLLPTALNGDTFVGMERYAADVQGRFQMSVPEFEEQVRRALLEEKFRRLVTDGISITPGEVQQEFKRRNEKVKLEYALLKPSDMEAQAAISDAETTTEFEKNKARYTQPERRVVRYALLDINQLRQRAQSTDDELKMLYQERIKQFEVPNRVHAEHILFKTVGKTDAEVEEIRKKAEEVQKKAQKGAKFEDLAKQYSEDTSKDKGGDLGWIVEKQTVPEFEKVAFSLPKGGVSGLVRTQYGFHIIKVLDHENAHTQPFDEVRNSLQGPLANQKADQMSQDVERQIAAAIRKSNRTSLDDLAKQFHLPVAETHPVSATEPLLELGNSKEARDMAFSLRPGELSSPVRTQRGYVILTVKDIQPARPATLAEVRDRVLGELKQKKGLELAKSRAAELAKRAQSGESLSAAAKALGLEAKTSDLIPRSGSISGVASGKQLNEAFRLPVGKTSQPLAIGTNWLVYRVAEREEPKQEDFEKQRKELEQQVLQSKQTLAYEAFRSALEERLRHEGKVKINPERLKAFGKMGGQFS